MGGCLSLSCYRAYKQDHHMQGNTFSHYSLTSENGSTLDLYPLGLGLANLAEEPEPESSGKCKTGHSWCSLESCDGGDCVCEAISDSEDEDNLKIGNVDELDASFGYEQFVPIDCDDPNRTDIVTSSAVSQSGVLAFFQNVPLVGSFFQGLMFERQNVVRASNEQTS